MEGQRGVVTGPGDTAGWWQPSDLTAWPRHWVHPWLLCPRCVSLASTQSQPRPDASSGCVMWTTEAQAGVSLFDLMSHGRELKVVFVWGFAWMVPRKGQYWRGTSSGPINQGWNEEKCDPVLTELSGRRGSMGTETLRLLSGPHWAEMG